MTKTDPRTMVYSVHMHKYRHTQIRMGGTGGVALLGTETVSGCVIFKPEKRPIPPKSKSNGSEMRVLTRVEYYFEGLPPNSAHGLHIHEWGDIRNGCVSTGGHFNPFGATHGAPDSGRNNRHVGDMGNIRTDRNGVAAGAYLDPLIKLTGKNTVIGRCVVLHEDEDDLGLGTGPESLRTGNSGARICCGIIGIAPIDDEDDDLF